MSSFQRYPQMRRTKNDAIKRLDSKCKEKPPLPDTKLVAKWSLNQFNHNGLRFLDNCQARKEIQLEMDAAINCNADNNDDPTVLDAIAKFNEEQEIHKARKQQRVKFKYVLAPGSETQIFCDTVEKLISSGFCEKLFSEFTLELIQNQYHLLSCCSSKEVPTAAAVIEPFHDHYLITQDVSGLIHQQKDSSVMLVHNLCYTTIPSLLQLLYAIDATFTKTPFDYILFDITHYTEPDQLDPKQLFLNAMGKWFVKAIPPFKQMQIDDVLYIGITKQQLGSIVASDLEHVKVPENIFVFDLWSPTENAIRFGTTTKKHKLPRVHFIIPKFGQVHLQGEKQDIKRLVKKRFGMKESEFEKAWGKASAHTSNYKNGNCFVQVKLSGAGANSNSICAWEAFCCVVKVLVNDEASFPLMQRSVEKELYKDLRFTKPSIAAPNKKTLIQLMRDVGFSGKLLWKDVGAGEKLENIMKCPELLHCAVCLIQDDLGAAKHAIAVDCKSKLVYDGYDSVPMPLTKESFDIACGIGRKCIGVKIVMAVTLCGNGKKKRKRK